MTLAEFGWGKVEWNTNIANLKCGIQELLNRDSVVRESRSCRHTGQPSSVVRLPRMLFWSRIISIADRCSYQRCVQRFPIPSQPVPTIKTALHFQPSSHCLCRCYCRWKLIISVMWSQCDTNAHNFVQFLPYTDGLNSSEQYMTNTMHVCPTKNLNRNLLRMPITAAN